MRSLAPVRCITLLKWAFLLAICFFGPNAFAATLSLTPGTGVYTTGQTFTARVVVNTGNDTINAAEGTLSFKPSELQVVSVSKGSIFNLWTAEPSFSNAAGTISFSGGTPSGYKGSSGSVLTITFRAANAGSPRVNFSSGSVLAADGRGTNVLNGMTGGSYTISAASASPEPEAIIEYVPPANTPGAPEISSATHPDSSKWYPQTTAELSWKLPAGVTAMRTLLNDSATSIPTKVYDAPQTTITLTDLEQGVQYFHLQFKNEDGWGKVTHYRLAIDSVKPETFALRLSDGADLSSPTQVLIAEVTDATSPVSRFKIQLDGADPFEYEDTTGSSTIELSQLEPGYHTAVVEAFDAAGNSIIASLSFTILAFDKPQFIDVPTEISAGIIPVFKGQTRPQAAVEVTLRKLNAEPIVTTVMSDGSGVFSFIPDGALVEGVYELSAVAVDQYGAKSESSDIIRVAVQQPGYLRIGSLIVSVLSVIVPLLALVLVLIFSMLFVHRRLAKLRSGVSRETREALEKLQTEFAKLDRVLAEHEVMLQSSRKNGKLTKAELSLVEAMRRAFTESKESVVKEIRDVTEIVD